MTVALVFPPTCDPTSPYVSVPLLTGWLRAHGVEVLPVDANVGACDHLLRPDSLRRLRARVVERYRELNGRELLGHQEQGLYLALLDGLRESRGVEERIEPAIRLLRGEEPGFYELASYEKAVATVERSLGLVSAAYAPLELSFAAYRSPFSLLDPQEREADSGPERNPYHEYFGMVLIPELLRRGVSLVGISVVFPGQIQPAYSLAYLLKATPGAEDLHVTVGGPAMSQILGRLGGLEQERALRPFDTAVLYEGEQALLDLVRRIGEGQSPRGVIRGTRLSDLSSLPTPDFGGLPLERYLSPEPVLPYDLSRGCPWGKCAFCHYGLTDAGAAPYRERPPAVAAEHLSALQERHGARLYYLSQDSIRPEGLVAFADSLGAASLDIRWSTDVRPERLLADPAFARRLRARGALSFSFGVESGSARVLRLIRKGIPLETVREAIRSTAAAGIAVEAMVFTGFPTETGPEAMETLDLLREMEQSIALFMCGTFALTSGSAVAREPGSFDIEKLWSVRGDELRLELQYAPRSSWKTARDHDRLEAALGELSGRWRFASYPWAGSLSTAHTALWYDRFGPEVFRRLAAEPAVRPRSGSSSIERPRFDRRRLEERFAEDEAGIWRTMVTEERAVSRERYEMLASRCRSFRRVRGGAGPKRTGR